jgi:hypothetical protein
MRFGVESMRLTRLVDCFEFTMKRLATIAILVLLGVTIGKDCASAQSIFASPWTITGTTNSPVFQSNLAFVTFPARNFYFSNVTNTNGIFIGSYNVSFPGTTNYLTLGMTNITFASTGATTVYIPQMTFTFTNQFTYQAQAGTNTYSVLAP